jgi:hypothetical protein
VELLETKLTSPMVLAFALGIATARARSNLRLPAGMYAGLLTQRYLAAAAP